MLGWLLPNCLTHGLVSWKTTMFHCMVHLWMKTIFPIKICKGLINPDPHHQQTRGNEHADNNMGRSLQITFPHKCSLQSNIWGMEQYFRISAKVNWWYYRSDRSEQYLRTTELSIPLQHQVCCPPLAAITQQHHGGDGDGLIWSLGWSAVISTLEFCRSHWISCP